MPDPDRGRVAATRQSGRGRAVLEHAVEYSLWTTRHSEPAREDHNRRSGCVHADRPRAGFIEPDWLPIGVIVNTSRTCGEPEPDSSTGTTSTSELTGNFTRERASCITCGDEVKFARCAVRSDRLGVASKS